MKKSPAKLTTRDDAENAMQVLATASNKRDRLMAKMNQELTTVRKAYEDDILHHSGSIEENESSIQKWADKNQECFDKARSLKMVHGTIGYRTAPPAVRQIAGFTALRILGLVKAKMPSFIRTKEELDKEQIIAQRATLQASELADVGLRIEQSEKFYCEPKTDETPT